MNKPKIFNIYSNHWNHKLNTKCWAIPTVYKCTMCIKLTKNMHIKQNCIQCCGADGRKPTDQMDVYIVNPFAFGSSVWCVTKHYTNATSQNAKPDICTMYNVQHINNNIRIQNICLGWNATGFGYSMRTNKLNNKYTQTDTGYRAREANGTNFNCMIFWSL